MSRRLEHEDGTFAGVALATIKLDFFESAYSKLDVGQAGTVLLASDEGILYYRRPFSEQIIGRDVSTGPLMKLYRTHGNAGTSLLTAKIDNVERLYSYRHLEGFPLIVAAAHSSDDIYAGWRNSAVQLIGSLVFFIALLSWGGTKLLNQLAIRERLETQLHLVSDGLAQANSELSALALKDGLTQLANRRAFDSALSREYARAKRSNAPVSLLMIDVDHFKQYNDHYGHPAGDACLRQVAKALSAQVTRETDLPARYGGEEFVVLLPATDACGAKAVAERVLNTIANLNIAHAFSPNQKVTVSIGVATAVTFGQGEESLSAFLTAADTALYQSKAAGRNRMSAVSIAEPQEWIYA
ncbi:hypothetical protein C2862_21130 [Massilia sp. Mn16-1_5]|nr:hypothetical protein C2862_21130 [Massilia sp. Mn16-1_5]